ncbi:MAG: triose-phosphate isomerase [Dehalococcoidia bacterium]|nr:triose-phosphate isomerase [Dehalococcoidia bacterium]
MRMPIIVGNWKMNTNIAEAVSLVISSRNRLDQIQGVEKVVCPPFVWLAEVRDLLKNSTVKLGAQNVSHETTGAYTGEISTSMLATLCQHVILGHCERRRYFCENDETVNRKLVATLSAGLVPIVCVGEELEDREAGRTEEVVTKQVKGIFDGVKSLDGTVIAYEPVWAIGTGETPSGPQANATIGVIRQIFDDFYGWEVARTIRILYGGSVNSSNIAEFVSQPEIDGALLGRSSLKADEFVSIVRQTAQIKNTACSD